MGGEGKECKRPVVFLDFTRRGREVGGGGVGVGGGGVGGGRSGGEEERRRGGEDTNKPIYSWDFK